MGRGGGVTPERVVQKINEEVDKIGQNATARAIGIPLRSVQKYMSGIAEPSQATFQKLSDYFGVAVGWLRNDGITGKHGGIDFSQAKPIAICAKCGNELVVSDEGCFTVDSGAIEVEGDGILRFWPCETCCKK